MPTIMLANAEPEMDHKLAMVRGDAQCEDCPGCEGEDIYRMSAGDYFWCSCADCAFRAQEV